MSTKEAERCQQQLLYPLLPCEQDYDWGVRDDSAMVSFINNENKKWLGIPAPVTDREQPHAELWMGTHAKATSKIFVGDSRKEEKSLRDEKGELPFLFKFLSVSKPLSIQAHPDAQLAERLHANYPALYPDPKHKPEIALAITDFEALAGFRPLCCILFLLSQESAAPELKDLLLAEEMKESDLLPSCKEACLFHEPGEPFPNREGSKKALKRLFEKLMKSDKSRVEAHLHQLIDRLSRSFELSVDASLSERDRNISNKIIGLSKDIEENVTKSPKEKKLPELQAKQIELIHLRLLRAHLYFPYDVGLFSFYLLHSLRLKPGEALFMGPNEPHCYLLGECVECMACSDNVVRAGLTPKEKDVTTLTEMLTYSQDPHPPIITKSKLSASSSSSGDSLDAEIPSVFFSTPANAEFQLRKSELSTDDLQKVIEQLIRNGEPRRKFRLPLVSQNPMILCIIGLPEDDSISVEIQALSGSLLDSLDLTSKAAIIFVDEKVEQLSLCIEKKTDQLEQLHFVTPITVFGCTFSSTNG